MTGVLVRRLLAMVIAGVLLGLTYGLEPWWPAAWLAPIPLLLAAFAAPPRVAWWLGCGAGLIGGLAMVTYYAVVTTPVIAVVLTLLLALSWGVVVSLARRAVVNSTHWMQVFAYPVLWAAHDTLLAAISPHGSAGSLAYSQMNGLPVIQVASLAGTPGIVFVVSLFGSIVAVSVYRRRHGRPAHVTLPLLVLLITLGYGVVRLALAETTATLPVGLAALDVPPDATRGLGEPLWDVYARTVETLATRGARIVVLPEKIEVADAAASPALQRRLGQLAARHGVHLVVGITVLADGRKENRAWLFASTGALAVDYLKQHLIPGLEGAFTPGREDAVHRLGTDSLGVAICKDFDFPALGRRYAAKGAEVALVPSWDFARDAWQHGRMAMLRGVESGFTVVRAARNGLLTVSDRYGRVLAETPSLGDRVALLVGQAPLGGRPTLYARFGDVFGWSCVLLALGVWVVALRPDRRATRAPRVEPKSSG
ncbi:MAG: hypothetical protein DMD78_09305 [Candidatus Rokuibacteriota bacterium]|nr:MAG: hypothetical protein DMD78_09305 [Candidatus Rokubacteria bacterium]